MPPVAPVPLAVSFVNKLPFKDQNSLDLMGLSGRCRRLPSAGFQIPGYYMSVFRNQKVLPFGKAFLFPRIGSSAAGFVKDCFAF